MQSDIPCSFQGGCRGGGRLKRKEEVDNQVALDAIHYEASQVCVHRVNVSDKKLQFLPLHSSSILETQRVSVLFH